MPKIKQNLVLLVEPPEDKFNISLKAGNMCLNRFCIDEDASFEFSGVYDWKKGRSKEAGKGNYPSQSEILTQIFYHELKTPNPLSVNFWDHHRAGENHMRR